MEFLHKNALFKNYLKFGEYYYEGRNLEKNLEKYSPGTISNSLRNALGISLYSNPPWIDNFRKFGLPPSYFTTYSNTGFVNYHAVQVDDIRIYYNLKTFSYWGDVIRD